MFAGTGGYSILYDAQFANKTKRDC